MNQQPYHKYVFDVKNRKFVGKFEEMYANENKGNYDSWFQDDVTHLGKQMSLLILSQHKYNTILDIGCGKGAFTQLLKTDNNEVTGVDISETAIKKARSKHSGIEFIASDADEILDQNKRYDLVVMMEILSYLENWKMLLNKVSSVASYLYLSLYLPPNPIGFVKDFTELENEIKQYFDINTEMLWNNETLLLLAKTKC